MQAPYYNSWYPITSCCSDMCQAPQDSILRMQQDNWVGAFYPNIFDEFEFIELK